jgi:dolichyl-phosphate beta-glucosyltransferase
MGWFNRGLFWKQGQFMADQLNLSLIFPAYNEARSITNTLNEAVEYLENRHITYEIIVSVDGTDGTREIVAELSKTNPRIIGIGSAKRAGKGRGIRNAVAIATGKWIGFSDADNKTPITEMDKFIPLLDQGIEMVIGSRGSSQSLIERPQPMYRRVGAKGFALFMHVITGLWEIADTQCGFKFFQAEIAKDLFSRQRIDGYMYDVEIIYLAKKAGYRMAQVPIRWRDDGDSRLQLLSGNIRNVRDVISIRFRNYSPPAVKVSQAKILTP